MTRKKVVVLALASAVVLIAAFALVLSRQRLRRRTVFHQTLPAGERRVAAPKRIEGVPPVGQWTATFAELEISGAWNELDELLDEIEKRSPDLYSKNELAYLHARARLESDDAKGAAEKLAPFLAPNASLRDLALYHEAELAASANDDAKASEARSTLIFTYPNSVHRDEAIDEEIEYLASLKSSKPLTDFATKLFPSADSARRRDLQARRVELLLREGNRAAAVPLALTLLRAGNMDDASDHASRAIDQPEILHTLQPADWELLGETFRNHRHFERAVALLQMALPALPAKRDDLQFSIGRSYFGNEQFAEARQWYERNAATATTPKAKSTALFHASRCAQLLGDDAAAERLMAASLAVPGRFPATSAALAQRMRTRLVQGRWAEASSDLATLRNVAPKEHAVVEASVAFAMAQLAKGDARAATATLNAIPKALQDQYDPSEIGYWRARALESFDSHAAFLAYLGVLRATVPTHFAYFARQRLDSATLAPKLTPELRTRDAQIAQLLAAKQYDAARLAVTDRILLSSQNRAKMLATLADIYRQLPKYKEVLELRPAAFPQFPLAADPTHDRAALLMAMGLFDETADQLVHRYPLRPLHSALTQSLALERGDASKLSIYAIEVLMQSVPKDFHPDLLPLQVRQLLYPRYFFGYITEDAKKYDADPTLVLSIMREESRFNPRAKSQAAARGLLQFIITTARDIGHDVGLVDVTPEDLYDPRVIIRLGAKYIATLTKQFGGDHYKAAAAYNAGPKQVALWSRLAPAAGDDYFLSSINFDETKHYVRKVMNSYRRYSEIYGNGAPAGGMTIQNE